MQDLLIFKKKPKRIINGTNVETYANLDTAYTVL